MAYTLCFKYKYFIHMISVTYSLCNKYRYLLFIYHEFSLCSKYSYLLFIYQWRIVCAISIGFCYSYVNDVSFVL